MPCLCTHSRANVAFHFFFFFKGALSWVGEEEGQAAVGTKLPRSGSCLRDPVVSCVIYLCVYVWAGIFVLLFCICCFTRILVSVVCLEFSQGPLQSPVSYKIHRCTGPGVHWSTGPPVYQSTSRSRGFRRQRCNFGARGQQTSGSDAT